MFKLFVLAALLAVAIAAPKPGYLATAPVVAAPITTYSSYSSPYAYTEYAGYSGYVSPYAYSAYAAPYAYSAYSAPYAYL